MKQRFLCWICTTTTPIWALNSAPPYIIIYWVIFFPQSPHKKVILNGNPFIHKYLQVLLTRFLCQTYCHADFTVKVHFESILNIALSLFYVCPSVLFYIKCDLEVHLSKCQLSTIHSMLQLREGPSYIDISHPISFFFA